MANYYTHLCFAFDADPADAARLKALVDHDWDSSDEFEGPLLAGMFPEGKDEAAKKIFNDADFPYFSADFDIDTDTGRIMVTGEESPDLEAIANAIQIACRDSLKTKPVGFEWASVCDKMRLDSFSGGWCAIFHDRQEWENTSTALAAALEGGIV
jgi:hypothetical protein